MTTPIPMTRRPSHINWSGTKWRYRNANSVIAPPISKVRTRLGLDEVGREMEPIPVGVAIPAVFNQVFPVSAILCCSNPHPIRHSTAILSPVSGVNCGFADRGLFRHQLCRKRITQPEQRIAGVLLDESYLLGRELRHPASNCAIAHETASN